MDKEFKQWKAVLEDTLTKRVSLTINDVGFDDVELKDMFESYQSPDEIVTEMINKYDLMEVI